MKVSTNCDRCNVKSISYSGLACSYCGNPLGLEHITLEPDCSDDLSDYVEDEVAQ